MHPSSLASSLFEESSVQNQHDQEMAMKDIMNSVYGGNYVQFLMSGSSSSPNANTGQPEAANAAAATAVEVDQTHEAKPEPEAPAVVPGTYVDMRDLEEMILTKKQYIQREQQELEQLKEARRQLLQQSPKQRQQRLLNHAQSNILNEMLSLTDNGIIDGFVYGLITKDKEPISAASENLRGWWQDKARFDRNGPMASSCPTTDNININSLFEIQDKTLESLLSALMLRCSPPQRSYPFYEGIAPPWWPTGNEEWWRQLNLPDGTGLPPYRKPHTLKKKWKVTVLVAIVKHLMSVDSHPIIIRTVEESNSLKQRMSAKDSFIWSAYIEYERNLSLELNAQKIPDHSSLMDFSYDQDNENVVDYGVESFINQITGYTDWPPSIKIEDDLPSFDDIKWDWNGKLSNQ